MIDTARRRGAQTAGPRTSAGQRTPAGKTMSAGPGKPGDADAPANEEIVVYQNPFLFLKIWEVRGGGWTADRRRPRAWHYHKEVEFLAVTEGRVGIQTKDGMRALECGDIALLGSSQLHRTHNLSPEPYAFIVFQVNLTQHIDQIAIPYLNGFAELAQPLGKLNYIFQDKPAVRDEAFSLIRDIYRESLQRERGYELAIGASIKRLLWLLVRHDTRGVLQMAEERDLNRLRPVLDYVERGLKDKITVEEASRIVSFSYHYFIRYFRRAMGMSFIEYVNYKRIKKAERLLLTRDLSIVEIAAETGIPNMAQFYKLFKRYNRCSPKQFKARMNARADPPADAQPRG